MGSHSTVKPVISPSINTMAAIPEPDQQSLDEKQHDSKLNDNQGHRHHHPFHHHQHKSHRLLHLIHPSGKHFHIVHHPHEIETKRREIALDRKPTDLHEYDVVVYGSPEHISCIHQVSDHHLQRRDILREKNAELFQEFDELHETLDHLSDELNRVTTRAIALDASFSKFGYDAQIRTKDDLETSSILSRSDNTAEDRHKDRSLEPLRFWRTPEIRQYFHKGLLWRSARSGEVGSFELFTDLVYVGVIDYVGEVAVLNASSESFLHFVIVFSLAYKIWSDLTVSINWFEVNDVVGRFVVLFIICCLYGFNCNVEYFFSYTNTAGTAFYLAQRMFMLFAYVVTSLFVPMIRATLISHVIIGLVACSIYIASIHVDYPYKIAPLFCALLIDYTGGFLMIFFVRGINARKDTYETCGRLAKAFAFIPAMNIEHRVERTSAFTTLVFGYSILRSLFQSHAQVGMNSFFGKGILVIVQAFTIMWIYFDIDAWAIHVHAIRRHWSSSVAWITAHLPLSAGFILAASTLAELVLAHDCENSDPHDLASTYEERSSEEVSQPLRWFYCGGLAVTLFFMTLISHTHIHKKINIPRITKTTRLIFRLCIVAVLICLPLAGDKLNSLQLIGITTSLFIIVLTMDIWGNTCEGHKFWTGAIGRCPDTRCKYTAKMKMSKKRKEELGKRMLNGENITVEDALRRRQSEISSQETLVDLDRGEDWHGTL